MHHYNEQLQIRLTVFAALPLAGLSISISTTCTVHACQHIGGFSHARTRLQAVHSKPTSPSMISVSSLMRTPMAFRKACRRPLHDLGNLEWIHKIVTQQADCVKSLVLEFNILFTCVNASVFDISNEKISDAAIIANGVASPKAFAMPIAMAVLPVPG